MTIQEAIDRLLDEMWDGYDAEGEHSGSWTDQLDQAIEMAVAALRAQQEAETQSPCTRCGYGGKHLDALPCTTCPAHPKKAEKNEPLTVEELREMDGEPVWTEDIGHERSGKWEICCGGGMGGEVLWFADEVVRTENYGKTWLAYRHKKEASK